MKKNLKQSKLLKEFTKNPIVIDENMLDHSNDPFVLRKLEIAEKFIAQHSLPESIDKPKPLLKPKAILKAKAQRTMPKTNTGSKPKV
jgi:hypothetical protein